MRYAQRPPPTLPIRLSRLRMSTTHWRPRCSARSSFMRCLRTTMESSLATDLVLRVRLVYTSQRRGLRRWHMGPLRDVRLSAVLLLATLGVGTMLAIFLAATLVEVVLVSGTIVAVWMFWTVVEGKQMGRVMMTEALFLLVLLLGVASLLAGMED